jgi:hypothetical protein
MKKIERFPKYEFHHDGYVVSRIKKNPRVLKPIKMGNYVGLQLVRSDGHTEKAYLHRLICEAFHGPCPPGMECRHLDGDKTNNAANNLAWGTRDENTSDRTRHGTNPVGERNPMAKLTYSKVLELRRFRAETGKSYKLIGLEFGVSTMTAYRAATGQSWSECK